MKTLLLSIAPILWMAACGGPSSSTTTPEGPVQWMPDAPVVKTSAPLPVALPEPKAVGTVGKDLIPRAVLFGNPERSNVQLSPDGKQVSWIAPKEGVMNLWVAPIGKLDAAKVVTDEKTRPIRQYRWAFTNKHLLFMQDVGGDENFHVWRVDLADNKVTDLTPYAGARADILKLSETKPTQLVVGINDRDKQWMDAYAIDIVTGKATVTVTNTDSLAGFYFDDKLALRLASRAEADGSMTILAPDAGAWKTELSIPFEDASAFDIAGFSPDGKSVWVTDAGGRDTAALLSVDLKTKRGQPSAQASRVLVEDPRADVSSVVFHPTKHTIEAVSIDYQRPEWKVLDKSAAADYAALATLVPGADFYVQSRSLDNKTWLVSVASAQKPRRFYTWNRTTKKSAFLFAVQSALDQQPLVEMHPQLIKARDGLTLVSYLSLPKAADPDGDGKANAPVPMVLLVHGGPWGRDSYGFNAYHQLLANRGYAVLSVNFRASTGFGKKFLNAGNGQWGKAMHDDLLDAVAWAVDQKVAPKDKICIAGGSYGGYATLAGLTLTPDVFACGVDIVGPSNILTLLATIPPYWASSIASFKKQIGDWTTPEGKAALIAVSPVTHAAKIKRPLLIGQGANDPRVKQAESEQIVAAMQKAKLPVTYALFPDEGHGFARPVNNIAFWAVAEAFLSAHLGGVYQPITNEELTSSTLQIKAGKNGIPGI